MALKKTLTIGSLFAIFASGGFATIADAQQARLNTPSATFEHRAIEMPESTGPMATPGVFNYDAQAFAPFEFTNDKQLEPNCGYFFTIDKTYTHVSRSDRNGTSRTDVPVGGDWNWGERYQFGWMSDQDSGWQGSYQGTEGTYYAQGAMDDAFRFIGFNSDGTSTGGENQVNFAPRNLELGLPDTDAQAADFGTQPFGFADSFTNEFHVGELNRVFRQALKNGDYFEPYIGMRYTNVQDRSLQDAGLVYLGNDTQEPEDPDNVGHRFRQTVSNNAFGLQLGGRHNRRRGRFLYSTDGALATSYNHQRYTATDILFIDADRAAWALRESYFEENSFVPTLDLEAAVSFNITRDITIRGGVQLMYLWQGIARVNTLPSRLNPNSLGSSAYREDQFVGFSDESGNFTPEDLDGAIVTDLFGAFPVGDADNLPPDRGQPGIFDDSYIASGFTFGVEWKR